MKHRILAILLLAACLLTLLPATAMAVPETETRSKGGKLIAQINPNAKIVCEAERLRPEKSEVNRLLGDSTKLRELTGWAPQYTFEQGLAATIEFLRGNLDQYKVGQYIL